MRNENYQLRPTRIAAVHGLRSRRALLASSLPTAHRPLPRRGISLLEVLISMFVLLFGLMGVAAIFPVGNHYATQGEKYDRDVALVDAAFAEMKARGVLQPKHWLYASDPTGGTAVGDPVISQYTTGAFVEDRFAMPIPPTGATGVDHPGYVYVIDPLGAAAGLNAGVRDAWAFPWYDMSNFGDDTVRNTAMPDAWRPMSGNPGRPGLAGENWPIRRVGLDVNPLPGDAASNSTNVQVMPTALAQTIFQLRDDLTVELPKEGDRPGIQRWTVYDDGAGNQTPLTRANLGNYSWLATVVPATADDAPDSADSLDALQPAHPAYGEKFYDVSVAVLYKRDPTPSAATERAIAGELLPGGQLIIHDAQFDAVDAACEGIRPGQWIAVAGVLPATRKSAVGNFTPGQLLLKWYRVLSLDDETQEDVPVHLNPPPNTTIESGRSGRYLMLEGPDWPNPAGQPPSGTAYIPNLRVILLPGVIGVTTRSVRMEVDSPWTVQTFPN